MHTLVVDDDTDTQATLTAWLQKAGHSASVAVSVERAWELLRTSRFECIVSAEQTPTVDGVAFCQEVRESSDYAQCYFILYSRRCASSDSDLALNAGADDFLAPLDHSAFQMRIHAATQVVALRRILADQNANLKSLIEKLNSAFRTIESDLEAASEIQLSLLPTISEVHPSFSVEWFVLPSSFLCGDNLNYFMMQDRYLVFYQLDVAGKGIPSALLSVTLNQLLSPQPGSPTVRFDPQRDVKRIIPPVDVVNEF